MTFFQFMNKNVHVSAVHIAIFRSITEEGWQIGNDIQLGTKFRRSTTYLVVLFY